MRYEFLKVPIAAVDKCVEAFNKLESGCVNAALIKQHLDEEREVEGFTVVEEL